MHLFTHPAAHALSLALILVPLGSSAPKRAIGNDLSSLQKAECSYRRITATYEEVTTAYILENYAGGHLLRWHVQPSPQNPDSETLVTAVYEVEGPPTPDGRPFIDRLRSSAPPSIGITWRYSSLAAVRIDPANDYARDALESFTHTVDSFIARMVITLEDIALSSAPNTLPAEKGALVSQGTVLLVEGYENGWMEVRQPSSLVRGWAPQTSLQSLE